MNRRGFLGALAAAVTWPQKAFAALRPKRHRLLTSENDFEDRASNLKQFGYIDVYGWSDRTIQFTVDRTLLQPEHGDVLLDMMRKFPSKRRHKFERIVVVKPFAHDDEEHG